MHVICTLYARYMHIICTLCAHYIAGYMCYLRFGCMSVLSVNIWRSIAEHTTQYKVYIIMVKPKLDGAYIK